MGAAPGRGSPRRWRAWKNKSRVPYRRERKREETFFPAGLGRTLSSSAGPSRNEADIFRDGHLAGLADPVGGPVLQWLKSCYIPRSAVSSALAFTDERLRRRRGRRCMAMLLFSPSSSCVCSLSRFLFPRFLFLPLSVSTCLAFRLHPRYVHAVSERVGKVYPENRTCPIVSARRKDERRKGTAGWLVETVENFSGRR